MNVHIPHKGDAAWNFTTQLQYKNKELEKRVESLKSGDAYTKMEHRCNVRVRMAERARDRATEALKKEQKVSDTLRGVIKDTLSDIYDGCEKAYKEEVKWTEQARVKACERIIVLEDKVGELKAEIRELKEKKYELETQIQDLEERNAFLESQLNMDSTNSSKPSSTDDVTDLTRQNRKKKQTQENQQNTQNQAVAQEAHADRNQIPNNREETTRKPGGQPGHSGHGRRRLPTTTEDVVLEVPDEIKNNPDYEPYGEPIRRQLQNVRIVTEVTDYIGQRYRNKVTGKIYTPFPLGLENEVNYGALTKATMLYLTHFCNVSVRKVGDFLHDASGGQIEIADGTIYNALRDFAKFSQEEVEDIQNNLLVPGAVLHIDTTGAKVNGEHKAVSVLGGDKGVVLKVTDHKGGEVVEAFGLDKFDEIKALILISDREISFLKLLARHQICLAHIIRELKGISENESGRTWAPRMRELLQTAIHDWKNAEDGLPAERTAEIKKEFDSILECADKEYNEVPPSKYNKKGANLRNALKKHKEAALLFLDVDGVGATNNRAERWLRAFKRKLKQMLSFRSDQGLEDTCTFLSVIFTAQEKGENIFNKILEVFENRGKCAS